MQKTSSTRHCSNCYYPLPRFGEYCSHCGQKYSEKKVTVGQLVREFFAGILNFENKIWKTLSASIHPGKLTNAFFKGRQQRYVSPLRYFFLTAILFFAILNFWGGKAVSASLEEVIHQNEENNYYVYFLDQLHGEIDSIQSDFSTVAQADLILDSLYNEMKADVEDSISLGIEFGLQVDENGLRIAGEGDKSFQVSRKDIAHLSTDSIMTVYGQDKNYVERLIMRQNLRLQRSGESYVSFLLSSSVWTMLLLMPLLAMLLKIIYVRRGYYYVEHLIFSFHLHAFAFVLLSIVLVVTQSGILEPLGEGWVDTISPILWVGALLWIPIYFFKSLRRVYLQSRRKTFLKFCFLNLTYLILSIVAISLTFVVTALTY